MRARVHLGLEEPTAEVVAALDLEVYVAPLDRHVLRGDDLSTGGQGRPWRSSHCRILSTVSW
jgi:hypothetical protein